MCIRQYNTFSVDHVRADWLGCWDEFVQKACFKKLVCLRHIKQNNVTYLGRICTPCLAVSTGICGEMLCSSFWKLFSIHFPIQINRSLNVFVSKWVCGAKKVIKSWILKKKDIQPSFLIVHCGLYTLHLAFPQQQQL